MDSKIKKAITKLDQIAMALKNDHDIDIFTYSRIKGKINELGKELLAYDRIYDAKKEVRREHYATG